MTFMVGERIANNSNRRLAARGGRRQRKDRYVERLQLNRVFNTATGEASKAKDRKGNYIVIGRQNTTVPCRRGRSFYYDREEKVIEMVDYEAKVNEVTVRVRI